VRKRHHDGHTVNADEVVVAIANRAEGNGQSHEQSNSEAQGTQNLQQAQAEEERQNRAEVSVHNGATEDNSVPDAQERSMLNVHGDGEKGCNLDVDARDNEQIEAGRAHESQEQTQERQSGPIGARKAREEITESDGGVISHSIEHGLEGRAEQRHVQQEAHQSKANRDEDGASVPLPPERVALVSTVAPVVTILKDVHVESAIHGRQISDPQRNGETSIQQENAHKVEQIELGE